MALMPAREALFRVYGPCFLPLAMVQALKSILNVQNILMMLIFEIKG